jgi:hypothetical protein
MPRPLAISLTPTAPQTLRVIRNDAGRRTYPEIAHLPYGHCRPLRNNVPDAIAV